jgi:hypothetical protein
MIRLGSAFMKAAWIRICIPNVDPDPVGLRRAKMKEKPSQKIDNYA